MKEFEKEIPKQQTIKNILIPSTYPLQSAKRQSLNALVLKHIVEDLQPISVVQQKGFRNLVHALDPKYILPNRQTVVKLMKSSHKSVNEKMIKELKTTPYVALTTDMWSSKDTKDSFNGITVHYWLSESATLKSRVLDCSKFKNSHTSEELASDILRNLKEFGIFVPCKGTNLMP